MQPSNWNIEYQQQLDMLSLKQLEDMFNLCGFVDWPNAHGLNKLKVAMADTKLAIPEFVCQSELMESADYYEQIIYKQNIIPTRPDSWHDLFNGLIWLQFPLTKRLLNQQHVEDIEQHGLSPRTLRRNNLTHFDECGVVVTYSASSELAKQTIEQLQNHQWQTVFVDNREAWGKQLNTFVFGHANLEMLLQPFIGLTGKWLAIEVEDEFVAMPYLKQTRILDSLLLEKIKLTNLFADKKPLYPLPLLGVPGIWEANNTPEFYQNTDYFRPKPIPK